jgi:hypothetical protein
MNTDTRTIAYEINVNFTNSKDLKTIAERHINLIIFT